MVGAIAVLEPHIDGHLSWAHRSELGFDASGVEAKELAWLRARGGREAHDEASVGLNLAGEAA